MRKIGSRVLLFTNPVVLQCGCAKLWIPIVSLSVPQLHISFLFLQFLSPSRSSLFLLCAVKKVDSAGTHSTLRMPVGSRLADANVLSVPLYASASVRCWNGRLLSTAPVVGQGADTRCFPHSPWVFAGNSLRPWKCQHAGLLGLPMDGSNPAQPRRRKS